jgi:hypothetical protein
VSNRKAHRRENSFRRTESFTQHRLRRPGRSNRRGVWKLIRQWIGEISEVFA